MFRKLAISSVVSILALAGGAQAQYLCNLTTTNNYSCVLEIPMANAAGYTVTVNGYQTGSATGNNGLGGSYTGSGIAYVFETSNLKYTDYNDPMITTVGVSPNPDVTLADAEYVNGHARYTCHFNSTQSCPSAIKVKPVFTSSKPIRLTIHRINN